MAVLTRHYWKYFIFSPILLIVLIPGYDGTTVVTTESGLAVKVGDAAKFYYEKSTEAAEFRWMFEQFTSLDKVFIFDNNQVALSLANRYKVESVSDSRLVTATVLSSSYADAGKYYYSEQTGGGKSDVKDLIVLESDAACSVIQTDTDSAAAAECKLNYVGSLNVQMKWESEHRSAYHTSSTLWRIKGYHMTNLTSVLFRHDSGSHAARNESYRCIVTMEINDSGKIINKIISQCSVNIYIKEVTSEEIITGEVTTLLTVNSEEVLESSFSRTIILVAIIGFVVAFALAALIIQIVIKKRMGKRNSEARYEISARNNNNTAGESYDALELTSLSNGCAQSYDYMENNSPGTNIYETVDPYSKEKRVPDDETDGKEIKENLKQNSTGPPVPLRTSQDSSTYLQPNPDEACSSPLLNQDSSIYLTPKYDQPTRTSKDQGNKSGSPSFNNAEYITRSSLDQAKQP